MCHAAIQVGEKRQIQILAPTKKEGRFGPEPSVTVTATTPKGRTSDLPVAKTPTAFETTYGPHETGPHKLKVEYCGKEVPGSPFTIAVEKKMDEAMAKVQVFGLDTRKWALLFEINSSLKAIFLYLTK